MRPDHIIIERNIDQFHSRFLFEEDPDLRDTLLRLLIEEEDKFGSRREKIETINRKLGRGALLIEKQREILLKVETVGGNVAQARKTLALLIDSQKALSRFLSTVESC